MEIGMGMRIVIIVGLFLMLGFNNIKYALAEIGTASSYGPPYTRKFMLYISNLNLYIHLHIIQIND